MGNPDEPIPQDAPHRSVHQQSGRQRPERQAWLVISLVAVVVFGFIGTLVIAQSESDLSAAISLIGAAGSGVIVILFQLSNRRRRRTDSLDDVDSIVEEAWDSAVQGDVESPSSGKSKSIYG